MHDLKPNVYAKICPSREVLAQIGEKWTSLIIGALADRTLRFGELMRFCEGVSQKMLTQTLRTLERDGLVRRQVFADELPLKVEYSLTELGCSLLPLVKLAKDWAESHLHEIEQHRYNFEQHKHQLNTPAE